MQSNLWLLGQRFCSLFRQHGVSLTTSLDGPAHIHDSQRGEGCFTRTFAGIESARRTGLEVSVICTFTRQSAPHWQEVFEFFCAAATFIFPGCSGARSGPNSPRHILLVIARVWRPAGRAVRSISCQPQPIENSDVRLDGPRNRGSERCRMHL